MARNSATTLGVDDYKRLRDLLTRLEYLRLRRRARRCSRRLCYSRQVDQSAFVLQLIAEGEAVVVAVRLAWHQVALHVDPSLRVHPKEVGRHVVAGRICHGRPWGGCSVCRSRRRCDKGCRGGRRRTLRRWGRRFHRRAWVGVGGIVGRGGLAAPSVSDSEPPVTAPTMIRMTTTISPTTIRPQQPLPAFLIAGCQRTFRKVAGLTSLCSSLLLMVLPYGSQTQGAFFSTAIVRLLCQR